MLSNRTKINEAKRMATETSILSACSSNIEPNQHSTTPSLLCDLSTCLGVPYHEYGTCAPTRADYTELFDDVFDSLVASVSDDLLDQDQRSCERTERKPTVSTDSITKPQPRFAPIVSDSDVVKARPTGHTQAHKRRHSLLHPSLGGLGKQQT